MKSEPVHSGQRVQRAKVERSGVERKRKPRGPVMRLGSDRQHVDDGLKFGLPGDRAHEMPEEVAFGLDMPERLWPIHEGENLGRVAG